jgi:2-oxoglutarate/2-oxoacid ferredoxin oxidoreductase subunit alpha
MEIRMAATDDLLIGMAGAGGDGVISAGESLINAAALTGYHAILTKSFGPQIRGGESSFRLRVAAKEVFAVSGTLDVAIALNWDDFLRFGTELPVGVGTTMIYESECGPVPDAISLAGVAGFDLVAAPITRLAKESGSDKMKNAVVLGLLADWLGFIPEALRRD